MNRRNVLFALFTIVGLIIDQASKAWVVANLELHVDRVQVIPGLFDIVHAKNPGAAFGLLGDFEYRHIVFLLFTAVAGYVIWDMFRKLPKNDAYMSSALGLIASGALGNLVDRLRFQEVTDFLRVYSENPTIAGFFHQIGLFTRGPDLAEYPTFNIADAALVIGVGMLVVHYLFLDDRSKQEEAPAEGAAPADDAAPAADAS